jgi:arabinofuranan 3-O-arabinosyltransferase
VLVLPSVTTDRLGLTFQLAVPQASYDPYTATGSTLPVGVAEVEVAGVTPAPDDTVVDLPCGAGPPVAVDGTGVDTAVRTTVGDLRALRPVPVTVCGGGQVALDAGAHRLTAGATELFATAGATLTRTAPAAVAGRTAAAVERWDAESRAVQVPVRDEDALLVVPENVNPGWVATVDGQRLTSTVVDGWQQAWVVPAGRGGEVVLAFTPGGAYRAALLAGAGAVVVLGLLVLLSAHGRRTRRPAHTATGGGRGAVLVGVGVVAGTLLAAGWVGGLCLAGLVGLLVGLRSGERVPAVLAGVATVVAGVLRVAAPGGTATAQQVLVVVALAAVGAAVLTPPGARWGST